MFRMLKIFFYLFVAWALFGCVQTEEVSRTDTIDLTPVMTPLAQDWGDANLVIQVPQTLSVSESDAMRPSADIVWREDPVGDRHMQVHAVLDQALWPVAASLDGDTPVRIEVTLLRFHALTERARYTIGGTHEISFMVTVQDRASGATLLPPRRVDLALEAFGGRRAIEADAAGQTQRVRITDHLRDWARGAFGLSADM